MSIYNHTAIDRTPYTYLIGWSKLDKYYYGCRYGKHCHPNDFWVSYFTSSVYVKNFINEHGEPDIIQIRRIFSSIKKCKEWEGSVLTKLNAHKNQKYINRAKPGSYGLGVYKYKETSKHTRITAYRKLKRMEESTRLILNLENVEWTQLKDRRWVNYKQIIFIYFLNEDERQYFLNINPDWKYGRSKDSTKDKISRSNTGKKKSLRTAEHTTNWKISNVGIKKPNSGPKRLTPEIIEQRKLQNKIEIGFNKLKRKTIKLYILNCVTTVKLYSSEYIHLVNQGWEPYKNMLDKEYCEILRRKKISKNSRGNTPTNMSPEAKFIRSEASRKGHLTRKLNL